MSAVCSYEVIRYPDNAVPWNIVLFEIIKSVCRCYRYVANINVKFTTGMLKSYFLSQRSFHPGIDQGMKRKSVCGIRKFNLIGIHTIKKITNMALFDEKMQSI